MNRYFAYIRVSTRRQGEFGASLPEQRRAIEKYARDQNLSIAEWYEEQETAAKRGRPIFSRMLAKLEAGAARGVIIHKIDRSARNLKDWANLADLMDAGIDVRFAHESIDLATRGGRLSADIQAVVAADYIRNLRDEIRKGINGRLREGIYPLPAPIGYLNMGGGKLKEVDPVRGPLVRMAFELYATGLMSMRTLRAEMSTRGLRTQGGKPLSIQSLWNMLHNPFYIGLMRLKGRAEIHQGKHQPLIAKATFDRVQAVANGKAVLKATKHDFLFRCFVRCAACGRHVVGERHKGKYVYYRCHGEGCRGTAVREVALDHEVQTSLAFIRVDAFERELLASTVATARGRGEEQDGAARQSLTLQLAKCDEQIERLTDALLDKSIDKETFEHRKGTLLETRRGFLDALEQLGTERSAAERAFDVLEIGGAAYSGYRLGNPYEKRLIMQSVCSNFFIRGKDIEFELKSPYREIADWRKTQSSGAPHLSVRKRVWQLLDIAIAADTEARKASVAKDTRKRAA